MICDRVALAGVPDWSIGDESLAKHGVDPTRSVTFLPNVLTPTAGRLRMAGESILRGRAEAAIRHTVTIIGISAEQSPKQQQQAIPLGGMIGVGRLDVPQG